MRRHRFKVLGLCLVLGCGDVGVRFQLRPYERCTVGSVKEISEWVAQCIADGPKSVVDEDLHWQWRCANAGEEVFSQCRDEMHPSYAETAGCAQTGWRRCDSLPKSDPIRVECESKVWTRL